MEDRMPTARPYRTFTIDLLAAEFVAARDSRDEGRLTLIQAELEHRGSRRAQALASHVRAALSKAA